MKTLFLPETIAYTGEQLRSLWAYMNFNLVGDCIVAFIGPCDVRLSEMVDQADVKAGQRIFSESMLHFIAEHFHTDIEKAILRQRLLVSITRDILSETPGAQGVIRKGDDLYDKDRKLSVSIATASPISALIHLGINISSRNTPVPTACLGDYDLPPRKFAEQVMARYAQEMDEVDEAGTKVNPVA